MAGSDDSTSQLGIVARPPPFGAKTVRIGQWGQATVSGMDTGGALEGLASYSAMEPSARIVQPGLCATSQGCPSGSTKIPE